MNTYAQTRPPDGGRGKPGFPMPLRAGRARPHPPRGRAAGEPGVPRPPAPGLYARDQINDRALFSILDDLAAAFVDDANNRPAVGLAE